MVGSLQGWTADPGDNWIQGRRTRIDVECVVQLALLDWGLWGLSGNAAGQNRSTWEEMKLDSYLMPCSSYEVDGRSF